MISSPPAGCQEKGNKMIQWALFIDPQQIGEKPEEGGETLTVGELIELLQTCDNNAHVFFRYSNGEKFGIINEKMFLEALYGY